MGLCCHPCAHIRMKMMPRTSGEQDSTKTIDQPSGCLGVVKLSHPSFTTHRYPDAWSLVFLESVP